MAVDRLGCILHHPGVHQEADVLFEDESEERCVLEWAGRQAGGTGAATGSTTAAPRGGHMCRLPNRQTTSLDIASLERHICVPGAWVAWAAARPAQRNSLWNGAPQAPDARSDQRAPKPELQHQAPPGIMLCHGSRDFSQRAPKAPENFRAGAEGARNFWAHQDHKSKKLVIGMQMAAHRMRIAQHKCAHSHRHIPTCPSSLTDG